MYMVYGLSINLRSIWIMNYNGFKIHMDLKSIWIMDFEKLAKV